MATPSLAQIQQQLAQQWSTLGPPPTAVAPPKPTGMSSLMMTPDQYAAQDAQRLAAQQEQNAYAQQQWGVTSQDPSRNPGAAMDRIIGLGEDTYANSNNATDQMLLDVLKNRIAGTDVPYNQTTIDALKTGSANQSGAAEMARNQSIMESLQARGFTPNDPAYQAALRESMGERQKSNQDANLSINQNANLANYNARTSAIGQANTVNTGQQQMQQNAAQILQGNYNQVSSQDAGRAPTWQAPTYAQFQAQQAQQPAQAQTAPRPAAPVQAPAQSGNYKFGQRPTQATGMRPPVMPASGQRAATYNY